MKIIQKESFEPVNFICETREEAKCMIDILQNTEYLGKIGTIELSDDIKDFLDKFFAADYNINL